MLTDLTQPTVEQVAAKLVSVTREALAVDQSNARLEKTLARCVARLVQANMNNVTWWTDFYNRYYPDAQHPDQLFTRKVTHQIDRYAATLETMRTPT